MRNVDYYILLVDDDQINNFIAKFILEDQYPNIKVDVCLTGEEVLHLLASGIKPVPDIILLDINMPKMDGIEFLEWYHGAEHEEYSTIFMFSTSAQKSDKEKALSFEHVAGYIEKPLSAEKIAFIEKKLEERSLLKAL